MSALVFGLDAGGNGMREDIQLEKGVRNLQHQNMWVIVFVADQDALAGSAHAMFDVVLFQSLQTCKHRGVLFWLVLFGTERIIAEREEANSLRLICVECFGKDRPVCIMSLSDGFAKARTGQL